MNEALFLIEGKKLTLSPVVGSLVFFEDGSEEEATFFFSDLDFFSWTISPIWTSTTFAHLHRLPFLHFLMSSEPLQTYG